MDYGMFDRFLPFLFIAILSSNFSFASCDPEMDISLPFREVAGSLLDCLTGDFTMSQIDEDTGEEIKSGSISLVNRTPHLSQMKFNWGSFASGYLTIGADTQKGKMFSINGNDTSSSITYYRLTGKPLTLISEPFGKGSVVIKVLSPNKYTLTQESGAGFDVFQVFKRVVDENP